MPNPPDARPLHHVSDTKAWLTPTVLSLLLSLLPLCPDLVEQVATFLLCLAFFYDIFWVFLSPQLFGESVMVKVATGGEITQDPTYCEKYPTDSGCQVRVIKRGVLLSLERSWVYDMC